MFTTINSLISDTKLKIDHLHSILDVLLADYRIASEIIDPVTDRRQAHLDQMIELNEEITQILRTHPTLNVDRSWHDAVDAIKSIASSEEIQGVSKK